MYVKMQCIKARQVCQGKRMHYAALAYIPFLNPLKRMFEYLDFTRSASKSWAWCCLCMMVQALPQPRFRTGKHLLGYRQWTLQGKVWEQNKDFQHFISQLKTLKKCCELCISTFQTIVWHINSSYDNSCDLTFLHPQTLSRLSVATSAVFSHTSSRERDRKEPLSRTSPWVLARPRAANVSV